MDEKTALIDKILASEAFRDAENLRGLLQFLFKVHTDPRPLFAEDIEVRHYGYPADGHQHDPGHSRERISKLKARLAQFAQDNEDDDLVCELPDATKKRGYRLVFRKAVGSKKATDVFWAAHLSSNKETVVVCDPLLFFYEHKEGKIQRFVDTNIDGVSRARALLELKHRHPKAYDERLIAGHFYIDVGCVGASELIRDYFWKSSSVRLPMVIEKEGIQQPWVKASPIFLGTSRTNTVIHRILGAHETRGLAYRLHSERYAWVTIQEPTSREIEDIKAIGNDVEWEGDSFTTTSPELTLGIVTRIPNPRGGSGVMTFICSDATRNTSQMASALTDEAQLRQIFTRMKHPLNAPLPDTFEMLFLVRLWPGDLDDDAGDAQLLCWRPLA